MRSNMLNISNGIFDSLEPIVDDVNDSFSDEEKESGSGNENSRIYNPPSGDPNQFVYYTGELIPNSLKVTPAKGGYGHLPNKQRVVTLRKFNQDYKRVFFSSGEEVPINSTIITDKNGIETVDDQRIIPVKDFNNTYYYKDTFQLVPRDQVDPFNTRKTVDDRLIITKETLLNYEFQYLNGKKDFIDGEDKFNITCEEFEGKRHFYIVNNGILDEITPLKPTKNHKRKKERDTQVKRNAKQRRKKSVEKDSDDIQENSDVLLLEEEKEKHNPVTQTSKQVSGLVPLLKDSNTSPTIQPQQETSSNNFLSYSNISFTGEDFYALMILREKHPDLFKLYREHQKLFHLHDMLEKHRGSIQFQTILSPVTEQQNINMYSNKFSQPLFSHVQSQPQSASQELPKGLASDLMIRNFQLNKIAKNK